MIVIHSWLASCNLFLVLRIIIKQPSPRRAAYCIPHGPLPQLFVKKCSLAHFRKKLPSDLLIWQICSAMSANDLINFWDQTIL